MLPLRFTLFFNVLSIFKIFMKFLLSSPGQSMHVDQLQGLIYMSPQLMHCA